MISKQANDFSRSGAWRGVALALSALLLMFSLNRTALSQAAPGGAAGTGGGGAGTGLGATGQSTTGTGSTGQTNGSNGNNASQNNTNNNNQQDTSNRDGGRDSNNRRAAVSAGTQDPRTEFQQMVEATTGRRLPIFGASLFNQVPSTFAPVSDVPVGPGYLLGPGDVLNVQMTGQVDQQMQLTVDRSGAISVPGLGSVHVAGLPYAQLNSFLTQQLGKLYRNFTINAQLGSLRTIQVFVLGQARNPGTFTISSLSTLTNAIFASGGPSPQGSLRDIQVKRDGVTIDHFDLYDLLLRGDKTKDVSLVTGDVIFIPFVGPQVAVVGSVDDPAIYELKGGSTAGTTIAEAIRMAGGGETAVAGGSTVRLERVFDHAMRSMEDVDITSPSVELRNGDILSVTSVIDRFKDAVTLRGNVANPGRYVWHAGNAHQRPYPEQGRAHPPATTGVSAISLARSPRIISPTAPMPPPREKVRSKFTATTSISSWTGPRHREAPSPLPATPPAAVPSAPRLPATTAPSPPRPTSSSARPISTGTMP